MAVTPTLPSAALPPSLKEGRNLRRIAKRLMPYFLSQDNLSLNKEFEITGQEAGHILLSHRVKRGGKLKIQGPDGKRFLVEVLSANKKLLTVKALEGLATPAEPKVPIILFQSVVSEKALDFIFQKGTELGLSRIVLFNSQNTATGLTEEIFQKKFLRWNKILIEAAKQTERGVWPVLEFVNGITEAVQQSKKLGIVYLSDISGNRLTSAASDILSVGLIVGPEGGFVQEETSQFKSLTNLQIISFGPILLRAETAALAGLAILRNIIL